MSMETFQNVDEWLVSISADVGDVPTPCWNEVELGCVAGLDEETTGTGYLITPVCATDGLGCYDVAASLYSPIQNSASECWLESLDIRDLLPYDDVALDNFVVGPTTEGDGMEDKFEIQLSTSLMEAGSEDMSEVGIGELESLLVTDRRVERESGQSELSGYITVDPADFVDDAGCQFDVVHQEDPVTVSYRMDEGSSSSTSEEDDTRDATWSRAGRRQRRCGRHRPKARRRLWVSRVSPADERKKQQNKSAATRYREKKRAEEIENEKLCAALERRNRELHGRVEDMTREVAVLRQLVIDIFRNTNNQ